MAGHGALLGSGWGQTADASSLNNEGQDLASGIDRKHVRWLRVDLLGRAGLSLPEVPGRGQGSPEATAKRLGLGPVGVLGQPSRCPAEEIPFR